MRLLNKFVLPISLKNFVPSKYALPKTNYRRFAATANREWIDLETICKTGKIPKTFNFARDVFEKHVVSRVKPVRRSATEFFVVKQRC